MPETDLKALYELSHNATDQAPDNQAIDETTENTKDRQHFKK